MIKRSDLINQFELLVKQEIINNQNLVSATNLRLNKIQEAVEKGISDLNEKFTDLEGRLNSKCLEVYSNIDKIKVNSLCFEKKIDSVSDSLIYFFNVEKKLENLEVKFRNAEIILKKNLREFELFNFHLESEINDNQKDTTLKVQRLKNLMEKSLLELKDEILSRPSEAEPVREELLKKLELAAIDKDSLLKELRKYKKNMFVLDKKMEHLFTLSERKGP